MYKIKQLPQDFNVEELTIIIPKSSGKYNYFWLNKTNTNTQEACHLISKALHIAEKKVGYAGTKDKNAITKQLISIESVDKERIESLNFDRFSLDFFGYGDEPISLGNLKGNKFRIVVRNIVKKPGHTTFIPNIYGEQRFSRNNAGIGRAIIKQDFKKAVELILESEGDIEDNVKNQLSRAKTNYVLAIGTVPKKIRLMYVHAFQSELWNKVVHELIAQGTSKNIKVPIIGFGTEFNDETNKENKSIEYDKLIENIYKKLMLEEKITLRDFIIRKMPELTTEGDKRELFIKIDDLKISELEDDELSPNMKKTNLEFTLPKGSYATTVIDYLFKEISELK